MSFCASHYYYVYDYICDARGDVVNLTDASGNVVASYAYDTWGNLTSASESIPTANGWVNPFRFDGRDGVRYDASTGLDWMSVRAYDPTLGRFLARDPLGRAPLFFADQPYAYAGNNPLSNVDPSGQSFFFRHAISMQLASPRPGDYRYAVWKWDNGAKKHSDRLNAWMGPIEKDTRGWHFNLHINRGVAELANYHFYYVGKSCVQDQNQDTWWMFDANGRRQGQNMFWSGVEVAGLTSAAYMAAVEASGYIAKQWNLPYTFFDRIINLPAGSFDLEWVVDAFTERHLPDMMRELAQKHPITTNTQV